ncbi:unknown [Ruminococcus sp. CAG:353]|nr:unknown [Ruminococcus sp. CAG:353]
MYVRNLTSGKKYGFAVKAYVDGQFTDVTSSDIVYVTAE